MKYFIGAIFGCGAMVFMNGMWTRDQAVIGSGIAVAVAAIISALKSEASR